MKLDDFKKLRNTEFPLPDDFAWEDMKNGIFAIMDRHRNENRKPKFFLFLISLFLFFLFSSFIYLYIFENQYIRTHTDDLNIPTYTLPIIHDYEKTNPKNQNSTVAAHTNKVNFNPQSFSNDALQSSTTNIEKIPAPLNTHNNQPNSHPIEQSPAVSLKNLANNQQSHIPTELNSNQQSLSNNSLQNPQNPNKQISSTRIFPLVSEEKLDKNLNNKVRETTPSIDVSRILDASLSDTKNLGKRIQPNEIFFSLGANLLIWNENIPSIIREHEFTQFGNQYEIGYKRHKNNHSFSVTMSYFQNNIKLEHSWKSQEDILMENVLYKIERDIHTGKTIEYRKDTVVTTSIRRDIVHHNVFRFANISFRLGYKYPIKKMNLRTEIGIGMNLFSSFEGKTFRDQYKVYTYDSDYINTKSSIGPIYDIGVGMSYRLSMDLELNVDIKMLNSIGIWNDGVGAIKASTWYSNIGVGYMFGNK